MDGPLDWMEAAWLEEHLDDCAECRTVDAEYAAQRAELLALRPPVPPRDLWARTSAALDAEAARQPRRATRTAGPAPRRGRGWSPFGAMGVVVATFAVAFLVGSQLLGPSTVPQIAIATPPASAVPSLRIATPILVEKAPVTWCSQENGTCEIRTAQIDHVCPAGSTSSCLPLDDQAKSIGKLSVSPKSIVSSPDRQQVIVVGTKPGTLSTTIYVVPVSGGISPTPTIPPATPWPTATANPSSSAGASSPTAPAESPVPPGTPAPTALAIIAIASNVVVVGQAAAYSPDGTWFAFSARPVSRQGGPDIYVWHAGDRAATALTTDHQSVFAGWAGEQIVGSRADPVGGDSASPSASPSDDARGKPESKQSEAPTPSATPGGSEAPEASATPSAMPVGQVAASSFLIDPKTRARTTLPVPVWRPIVDPLGRWVVYWQGTIATDAIGERWVMGTGQLMLGSWASLAGAPTAASPVPLALSPDIGPIDGADWDARWDDTGEHLAVWVGDRSDPSIGHLNLITIDVATGQPDASGRRLIGRPALIGFSLADGHLAWATPPGQDGQGSQLQVYAWSGPDAGQVHSEPATGTDTVIVVH